MKTRSRAHHKSYPWFVAIGRTDPANGFDIFEVDAAGDIVQSVRAAPSAASARTILILPGAETRVVQVTAPTASPAQARAAGAYQIGQSTGDGAAVHVAVSAPPPTHALWLAAAMTPVRLQAWLDRCTKAGFTPGRAFVDVTLLDAPADALGMIAHGEQVLVCGGSVGGFAADPGLAARLAPAWIDKAYPSPPREIAIDASLRPVLGPALEPRFGASLVWRQPQNWAQVLARAAVDPPWHAVDVLQGAFGTNGPPKPRWRAWTLAAALAAIAVVAQAGVLAAHGWRDQQAAHATVADAQKRLQTARADVLPSDNFAAQVRGLVNAERRVDANPFLAVAAPLRAALSRHRAVRLEDMRHDGAGRRVRVRVSAVDPTALQALEADLRQTLSVTFSQLQAPENGRAGLAMDVEAPQ